MATKARLETVITGDDAPFVAAVQRAENRAKTFSARTESFFKNAFKRDPGKRAERALSESISDLAAGDVQGAVGSLLSKISGIGIAAGVGVGAAVGILKVFSEEVLAAGKATRDLHAELVKPIGTLGVGDVTQELQKGIQLTDDFIDKRSTFFSRLGESFKHGGFGSAALTALTGGRVGSQEETADDRKKSFDFEIKGREAIAKAEANAVAIKKESLNVSERQGAIDKISKDASEKQAAIELEAEERFASIKKKLDDDEAARKLGKLGLSEDVRSELSGELEQLNDPESRISKSIQARKDAVTADAKVATDEINKQADLKQQEADMEGKILALKKQGLTTEEETTLETRLRIALLREQLGIVPVEQQKGIQNQITALKQSLPPDLRPPIGISGESPLGILDSMSGEFRTQLRPQEQANLRAGQSEAQRRMMDDQSEYQGKLADWNSKYQDYLRGADYYNPEELKRPVAPAGYDVDVRTGKVTQREPAAGSGPAKPITKEELQDVLSSFGDKYFVNP